MDISQQQDRRRYQRVPLNVVSRAVCAAGTFGVEVCDISRGGLLFRADVLGGPYLGHIGEAITVEVDLPTNAHMVSRYLQCRGRVVRMTEDSTGVRYIALALAQMKFCDRRNADALAPAPSNTPAG